VTQGKSDKTGQSDDTVRDPSRFFEPARTTPKEVDYRTALEGFFQASLGSNVEKLQNFPKYVPTQDLRRFISRYELYRKIVEVHGSIVECGVLFGGGLMGWAQMAEIHEPFNHLRNVIGFDTFEGFTSLTDQDRTGTAQELRIGGFGVDAYEDLRQAVDLFDRNRTLGHIPRVKLVRGDATRSIPDFLNDNPHTVVALLWIDFDIYEPTKVALEQFLPRMPKGAILAFDEVNHELWPGETLGLMEAVGLPNLRLRRFPFGSTMSYAVIE